MLSLEAAAAEYRRLVDDAPFSALAAVGRYLVRRAPHEKGVPHELQALVRPDAIARGLDQAHAELRRACRILSIGSRFEYEEIMLVATIRAQLALASSTAAAFGVDSSRLAVGELDEALAELASTKENARAYAQAISRMRKVAPDGRVVAWPVADASKKRITPNNYWAPICIALMRNRPWIRIVPTPASSIETRWGQLLIVPTEGYLEGASGPVRIPDVGGVEVSTRALQGGLAGRPLVEIDIGDTVESALATTGAIWSRIRTTWSVSGLFEGRSVEVIRVENPFVGGG